MRRLAALAILLLACLPVAASAAFAAAPPGAERPRAHGAGGDKAGTASASPASPVSTSRDGLEARLSLPAGEITVGDPVILKLTVTHPPGAVLDYPNASKLSATGEGQEEGGSAPPKFLVEEVQPVEAKPPRPGETSWTIRLRPFAPGDIGIPALPITYRLPGSTDTRTVLTEPVSLHVKSVLKSDKEEAADIKDPWLIPFPRWPWLVGALVLLAAFFVLRALWRRFRRRPVRAVAPIVAPPPPPEPPYDRALRELERLLASGLLAAGRVKEFHVQISEIVKRFLGAHYGFDALDRTTREVLADLALLESDRGTLERVRRFLDACDLVKFAKHRPTTGEIDETVAGARALIEMGRRAAMQPAGGVAA